MSSPKCRILYIDDHADSAEMLCLLFAEEDYEVVTAATIDAALTLANTKSFDLYVLDRRLPDGNGIELCQKLNEVTPEVPCIFYTGDAYEVHRRQALEAGADGYVAKPHVEELIEAVTTLLARKECATATVSA
jgi:DNA-binding response OmpR family regulator